MGRARERVILQADTATMQGFEQAGTLEQWRELVGMPCRGNHRLILAVSAGFAAPWLHHLEQQGFGLHFRGDSSGGKTTLLRAGQSVTGDHRKMHTWRATSSALEGVAALNNDCILCLDEIGEVPDPKDIGATAYMLSNGSGKLRQSRNMTLRPSLSWRLIFLSSGEVSLADTMGQVKQRVKAGQQVRVIDIPADAGAGLGVFDHLPEGFSGGGAFADYLKDSATVQHGTAFRAYLRAIVADLPGYLQRVRAYREDWKMEYLSGAADSQVKRVADSFATLAAGGELATDLGITGWGRGEAGEAAAVCFDAWVRQRGGLGNQEEADILRHVRNHFAAHGAARYAYMNLRLQDDKTMYRMGYRDEEGDFFVLSPCFEPELCKAGGFDRDQVLAVLEKHGFLVRGGDGRPTITKRVYSLDAESGADQKVKARVYHIDKSILSGGD